MDRSLSPDSKDEHSKKSPHKPLKALNRVPRACNACRKQKMKCEGAENPPCKRCRNSSLECLFEKPSREGTLTGEAGLERIRSLESQVADIRNSQHTIQTTLVDLVSHFRAGSSAPLPHTPVFSSFPHSALDPAVGPTQGMLPPILSNRAPMRPYPQSVPTAPPREDPAFAPAPFHHQHQLPPISTIHDSMPPPRLPSRIKGTSHSQTPRGTKPGSSNVTSNEDSDEENGAQAGELPAAGLVAPWEVLRGLAEAAAERAAKENGGPEINSTEPPTRAYSGSPGSRSPDKADRPSKRRKVHHGPPRGVVVWSDVVARGVITEPEARDLFKIFYDGCSTFLPVFDARVDTFDALHERSPFAVDCICMVAAKVRDGGGPPSDILKKVLEEVQIISCQTLFSPVWRKEAVQAMILVSGWSDNGWLTGGHAVRMAFEIGMHKAWPRLLKRMKAGKMGTSTEERELVISARTWFCLYLFEHQMSFGTGRPAILREDESITDCRYLLQHPLSIEDDMRLVSTVELMIYRERVHGQLGSPDGPLSEATFAVLREAEATFRAWYETWDQKFAKHYGDANFYRQSLQIQQFYAELFHSAAALRGVKGPEDVARMPPVQRQLALKAMVVARGGLNICLRSPSYREGLKYAVHYTHMTATFAASLLLRLARLFPDECDLGAIVDDIEDLAGLLSRIPAGRYARTLRIMLHAAKKRKRASQSPEMSLSDRSRDRDRDRERRAAPPPDSPTSYDGPVTSPPDTVHPSLAAGPGAAGYDAAGGNWDYLMRGFEHGSGDVPVWMSEHNLGDIALAQQGLEAFIIPLEFDQRTAVPQIW